MTTEELRARKKALGYTNKMVSELSGVPLGTVNKVFCGSTLAPRYDTLRAIEDVLMAREYKKEKGNVTYNLTSDTSTAMVAESGLPTFCSVKKRQGEYTADDWLLLPDDRRMELIEGRFYDLAEPLLTHQSVVGSLYLQFSECAEAHPEKGCMVFMSPVGVKLAPDEKTIVEPDLVVICGEEYIKDNRYITGPPELIVEVLSPGNRDHDLIFKQMIYRKYGVKEYWIVDPDKEKLLVCRLQEQDLPESHSFDESVQVWISGGDCSIDFNRVKEKLRRVKTLAE